MLGRAFLSVLVTDVINCFYKPSWTSILSIFIDASNFFIFPLMGGFVNSSVIVNYNLNAVTYDHANLDKNYLYDSQMLLVKDYLYSFAGRPNFFDSGIPYVATNKINEYPKFDNSTVSSTSSSSPSGIAG